LQYWQYFNINNPVCLNMRIYTYLILYVKHISKRERCIVRRCRRIHLASGTGTISNSENTYGTEVNVTCNYGYLIGGQTTMIVNCTASETWTFEPVSCERKSSHFNNVLNALGGNHNCSLRRCLDIFKRLL